MKNRFFKQLMVVVFAITNITTVGFSQTQNYLSFENFVERVTDYSQHIKQSEAQMDAMQSAVKLSKSAFLPAVDGSGMFQYRANESNLSFGDSEIPLAPNTFSTEIGVLQPIYSGGAITSNHKAAKIQSEMAKEGVDLTIDNILFAAESSYWGAAAQGAMYQTMCEYVDIISQLCKTLQDKYDDGMIAKTDLIQIQSRLKEAELQRSSSYLSYRVALQNLNSMMGQNPMDDIALTDSVATVISAPRYYAASEVMANRPDYKISKLDVDYQLQQIKIADSSYKPTLAVGFKESWGTQMINIDGSTLFNSNLFLSLKVPIFHGGARRQKRNMQHSILSVKESQLQATEDKISSELASSWTELCENINKVEIAKENCSLAEENLELNTFSYNEGKLQILDVLSAQLSWIQAYTNLIQGYYAQRISNASYQKVIGSRY